MVPLVASLSGEKPQQHLLSEQHQQMLMTPMQKKRCNSKWTAAAASAFSLFRPATTIPREFGEDNGKSIKASANNYEYEERS
ncbi:hypothetical protein H5410_019375 [Solanum commersonii]|uniref:Uncharacterized protein n=1 Tax=Solanum commersonii TaxID=4109 RepID=A0A9J5ZAZ5_SOLCO|nr:hypothetical protein H5410_019375 [Solanum commersonii]